MHYLANAGMVCFYAVCKVPPNYTWKSCTVGAGRGWLFAKDSLLDVLHEHTLQYVNPQHLLYRGNASKLLRIKLEVHLMLLVICSWIVLGWKSLLEMLILFTDSLLCLTAGRGQMLGNALLSYSLLESRLGNQLGHSSSNTYLLVKTVISSCQPTDESWFPSDDS